MDIEYNKVAINGYMDDISNATQLVRCVREEYVNPYMVCKQQYSRLYSEIEQRNRKAYNRVEEAESMQRVADIEINTATRLLNCAEDDGERVCAQRQLQHARNLQNLATEEFERATAAYEKAKADMQKLVAIWENATPEIEMFVRQLDEGCYAFIVMSEEGNNALVDYINIMDKVEALLQANMSSDHAGSASDATAGNGTDYAKRQGNNKDAYAVVSGTNISDKANGLKCETNVPAGASGFSFAYNVEIMLQVAEVQHFNKAPRVVSCNEFDNYAEKSGIIGYRTVGVDENSSNPQNFVYEFQYCDNILYNPSRYRQYGDGIYIVATPKKPEGKLDYESMRKASEESAGYGAYQMKMTFDESTRFIDGIDLNVIFSGLSYEERQKYCNKPNVYAAALGYDAIINKNVGADCDYIVVLNRTKLIVKEGYEEV